MSFCVLTLYPVSLQNCSFLGRAVMSTAVSANSQEAAWLCKLGAVFLPQPFCAGHDLLLLLHPVESVGLCPAVLGETSSVHQ